MRSKLQKKPVFQPSWLNSKLNLPQNPSPLDTDETPKTKKPKPKMKDPRVVINGFEGCICAECKDFYPYAEPNMDDGSMVCYSCRNPWMGFAKE